ncbi:hypothetical protein FHG87_012467 [Trinorchestia longiramus]|nr:hypothetical protein FHG87_012467 [Trinorchestia longiramus]
MARRRDDALPLLVAVVLTCLAKETSVHASTSISEASLSRVRRQGVSTPQLVPGPVGDLNVPIPTNIAVFGGANAMIDSCPRDEVITVNGTCQQLLTQGSCKVDEYVLLNPETDKGYCAPRLCPPDRVFIFSTQLCHDPREMNICPPGRELYESSYGTPVCQCPDGTYEGDDDLDDDVCEPILGQIANCPAGQVFWFRTLDMGPECVPDPCSGLNLNRGPNDLAFLPSLINGRCFQIGSSEGVCPKNTWYGLALDSLKGVCATLEEFGYNIFDPETLQTLIGTLGTPITGNNASPIPTPSSQGAITNTSISTQLNGGIPSTMFAGGVQSSTPLAPGGLPGQTSPHQTSVSSAQLPQTATPKPIEQVSKIQQQIVLLQQQLQQLQESLSMQGMPMPVSPQNLLTTPIKQQRSDSLTTSSNVGQFSQVQSPDVPSSTHSSSQSSTITPTSSPTVIKAKLESRITEVQEATTPRKNVIQHSSKQPISPQLPSTGSLRNEFPAKTRNQHSSARVNPFVNRKPTHSAPTKRPSNNNRAITFPSQNLQPTQRRVQNITPQGNRRSYLPGQRSSNVQILVQPSDFIQIQHQNQKFAQSNSLEQLTAFGQQFASPHMNNNFQSSFRSGNVMNSGQEIHGGGPSFIPEDSPEKTFSSRFFPGGRKKRSILANESRTDRRIRRRRSPLPHASPSNVFESRLVSCRGGAVRDINAKCRNVILPSRIPKRPVRAAPPVRPNRPCSGAFNIFRRCVPKTDAQNSVNAFALG